MDDVRRAMIRSSESIIKIATSFPFLYGKLCN